MRKRVRAGIGVALLAGGYGCYWSLLTYKTNEESLFMNRLSREEQFDRQVARMRTAGETPLHGVIGFRNDLPDAKKNYGSAEDPIFRMTVQYALAPILIARDDNYPLVAVVEDSMEDGQRVRLERRPERP